MTARLHNAGRDSRALAAALAIDLNDVRKILRAVIARDAGFVGAQFESVRIPLFDTHHTLCVSTQAGCSLGCQFCATGRLGLMRSLQSWEMVSQWLEIRADSQRPITGVVFMGQGEPFLNHDNVLSAAYTLSDPAAGRIDARRISVATSGIVPMIRRYTAEKHRFRLCVSLNAATDEKRRQLMPIAKTYPLAELIDAVREHAAQRDRVTISYVMMSGVNVDKDDARELGELLKGIRMRFNPIDVSDATGRFLPPKPDEWRDFRDALARHIPDQPVVRRYSGGQDQNAACGMLASKAPAA
jgi:23S rRNA (adenine2503-C2)-methyltransferase